MIAEVLRGARLGPYTKDRFAVRSNELLTVCALALFNGSGCAIATTGLSSVGTDEGNPTAPESQTTFEILSPGSEPRQPVRYTLHIGRRELGNVVSRETQHTSMVGQQLVDLTPPPICVHYSIAATEALPNDHFLTHYEVSSLEVMPDADADPGVVALARATMPQRAGTIREQEVTTQGVTIESTRRWSKAMDPADADELEQLEQVANSASSAFPPDPLGDGARWRATRTTSKRGVTSVATVVSTLLQRLGDRIIVEQTFEIHGTNDDVGLPLAPPQKIRIRSLTMTGKMTKTEDLQSLVPISKVVDEEWVATFDMAGMPRPLNATRRVHVVTIREP